MKRFTPKDNEQRFRLGRRVGRLEYPLSDPGLAQPGEGILWFGEPDSGAGWQYVRPDQVTRVEGRNR